MKKKMDEGLVQVIKDEFHDKEAAAWRREQGIVERLHRSGCVECTIEGKIGAAGIVEAGGAKEW